MDEGRSKKTKRNIITGLVYKAISILLPFLIRTAIIYCLGSQYVGLSSLFTSILQVLNLAELGFSSAIVYHMYEPIAQGNDIAVCALLNYYKKVYHLIGTIILISGITVTPFIPKLIKGTWPSDINIYLLFLLYLFNTAISYYLFAYKNALLNAVQRIDIVNIIQTLVYSGKYLVQLAVLVLFKSYYSYVVVAIVSTILFNIVVAIIANKRFPQYQPTGNISEEIKREVKKQVGGVMIGKLSDTSRNSFDNIVLSVFLGLTTVAIFNNYFYIFSALYGFFLVITQAMQASVGNSIALESTEKNYSDLLNFQFIFSWLNIVCAVCMLCVYQPFMHVWTGKELMLGNLDMTLFSLYFYVLNMNNMRNLYFFGTGLWWDARKTFIFESLGNLLLNFILGGILGVTGVLLATILTIIIFNFISRTNILFIRYFKKSSQEFYLCHFTQFLECLLTGAIAYFLCNKLCPNYSIMHCILRGIIAFVVSNLLLFILFFKTTRFNTAKELVIRLIKR